MTREQKPRPKFRFVRPRVLQHAGAVAGDWFGRLVGLDDGIYYSEFGPFATRKEAARELVNLYDPENVDGYMGDEGENLEETIHEDQAAWCEWALKEKVVDELSDEFVAKFARKKK